MPTQQRSEETRARLLQAAAECFAQHGYDGTGVAEICERAGMSKGAFYHHFPTKQAMFLALLDHWLGELDGQMSALQAAAPTVPEALRQTARVVPHVFEASTGQMPMFLEFLAQASRDPETWRATIEPYHRYHALFARMVAAGIAEGSLRPVDPAAAAHAILSFAVGLVLQGVLDPHGADWARVTQDSIEIILKGLQVT
jgi:AcrR family transcriptional regulator